MGDMVRQEDGQVSHEVCLHGQGGEKDKVGSLCWLLA